jgi:hypothetical protein
VARLEQTERIAREAEELPPGRRVGSGGKDAGRGRYGCCLGHRADSFDASTRFANFWRRGCGNGYSQVRINPFAAADRQGPSAVRKLCSAIN